MPRQMHNRECACGCGEISKSGVFAPGHDQKLRSRLEKRMEAAGYENGLLALADLVENTLTGDEEMNSNPNTIPEGKTRYAFSTGKNKKGNPCLFVTRQCYSQSRGRYLNDRSENPRPVTPEQGTALLAELLGSA